MQNRFFLLYHSLALDKICLNFARNGAIFFELN